MGQFVASMRREMDVPEQVEAYLASQPEPKQADLRRLHAHILTEFPGCGQTVSSLPMTCSLAAPTDA